MKAIETLKPPPYSSAFACGPSIDGYRTHGRGRGPVPRVAAKFRIDRRARERRPPGAINQKTQSVLRGPKNVYCRKTKKNGERGAAEFRAGRFRRLLGGEPAEQGHMAVKECVII
uniref:Uncharacterized protein n=1 Tax=Steinernema glaseri TaxID=37863 RepID=A0A1I7Z8W2_9BILA